MTSEHPVKHILRHQGRTQRWFAAQVPMNETFLSKILLGQRPAPHWFAGRACEILQVPEATLLRHAVMVPNDTETESGSTTA